MADNKKETENKSKDETKQLKEKTPCKEIKKLDKK